MFDNITICIFGKMHILFFETLDLFLALSQAATLVLKESVEPLLEEYRPPGITSLKFNKLSLGTVAPKIEGMN